MEQKQKVEILSNLEQFTGTEQYYQYLGGLVLTDGTKYLADACQCYWLMDIVVSCQAIEKVKKESFQVYELTVIDNTAKLIVTDGNENIIYSQDIECTDFPLPSIKIWYQDKVIFLPSEY